MTRTSSMTMFSSTLHAFIEHEKAAGGLGKQFFDSVVTLINENQGKSNKELVDEFVATTNEAENTLREEIKAAFGEDVALSTAVPKWRQCKSDFKGFLKTFGQDVRKYASYSALKKAKSELAANDSADPAPGKAGGSTGTPEPVSDTPTESGGNVKELPTNSNLSDSVRKKLNHAIKALEKMEEADALKIVSDMDRIAWSRTGQALPKVGAAVK